MMFMQKKNQKGFSLIEILLSIGLAGLLGLVATSLFTNLNLVNRGAKATSSLEQIRSEALALLRNDDHFNATLTNLANAGAFSCLVNHTNCAGATGAFTLFDKNNNPMQTITTTGSGMGLRVDGSVCNGFQPPGTGNGNDGCPFQYVATWRALCPQAQTLTGAGSTENQCRNPLIDIFITLQYSPRTLGSVPPVNLGKMQIHITRSQMGSDPQKLCGLVTGATYDSINKICVKSLAGMTCVDSCGAGVPSYVKGVNPDGSPKCTCNLQTWAPGTGGDGVPVDGGMGIKCPGGNGKTLVTQIRADRTIVCGPGLIEPLTAAGVMQRPLEPYGGGDGGGS